MLVYGPENKNGGKDMKRTTVIIAALLTIFAVTASATLLQYYGRITGTVNVKQSVVFSDGTTEKTYSFEGDAVAGNTYMDTFRIKNRANVPATVKFVDTVNGKDEEDGITTTYWKQEGYRDTKTTPDGCGSIPATITVEDLGEAVKWTINMDESNEAFSNGHAAVGLIIGVGDRILFQVHSNDGTCSAYGWGTWLYSPYDSTGGGWHTGEPEWNTPVDEMADINAVGARDLTDNPDLIFEITIGKKLLHPGEFKWAMALMGRTSDTYSPGDFSWTDSDTSHFHTATLGTEIQEGETFTIGAGETVTFVIVNEFDIALRPATYTITTYLEPVVEP